MVIFAHGRVNDPMAKLQFLRVGWGGVGMMTFFELEHMLAGCYATVFVLSLHTCWMLCNCVCFVIARMLDATQLCFLVNAHMLDATQLCLSCHCTPDVTTIVWRNMFGRFCSERTRGRTCLKHWANWPMSRQCQKMVKKRRLFFGGWFQYARIPSKTPLWRHEPMEKWDEMNIWTSRP